MKDDKLHVARMVALCTPRYMYNFLVPICTVDNSGWLSYSTTDRAFTWDKNKFQLPEGNKEIAVCHVRQLL